MKKENENATEQKSEANAAAANRIATIEEDNERRPLDKIEGQMNNGETGGASEDAQPETKR